jgi:hypothetical protein
MVGCPGTNNVVRVQAQPAPPRHTGNFVCYYRISTQSQGRIGRNSLQRSHPADCRGRSSLLPSSTASRAMLRLCPTSWKPGYGPSSGLPDCVECLVPADASNGRENVAVKRFAYDDREIKAASRSCDGTTCSVVVIKKSSTAMSRTPWPRPVRPWSARI